MQNARDHRKNYDALIVGSGASGGWVAKELCEAGMQVLMLEAGPPRIPSRDFTEHVWPYQLKYRGFGDQQARLAEQPIQRLCYACDEYCHQFFVNDHENPYTFPAGEPFMWVRGRQVGGKTFCWARESYRYSDYEFKAASRDGYGQDWPISYKDLEPYDDKVESYPDARREIPSSDEPFLRQPACQACHREQIRLASDAGPGGQPDRSAQRPARLPLLR
ncbi:MAG: hypothetical protein P8Z30_09465 [Acidobacteriota bacterium]